MEAPAVNFTLLLFILLLVTGAFWVVEKFRFSRQRITAANAAANALRTRREELAKQGIAPDASLSDENIAAARENLLRQPWWLEWTAGLFPVIAFVFLLRSFVAEPFKIPSGSMEPTLVPGDLILVNKFIYGLRLPLVHDRLTSGEQPQRGNVIVFRLPKDPAIDYIKRIVGTPGDTVSYENKHLVINGKPVTEKPDGEWFDPNSMVYYQQYQEMLGKTRHRILINPQAPAYVLGGPPGDFPHRENCHYNTEGFVCKVPQGMYFVMGDNRDNSEDSRYWGFVPERNIVGKAFFVWMNFGGLKNIGPIH
ncbi:signal peptidase I [mine drainage metagenome]|uniref:signal peptidase I n=1 Tax=mine drainage metagenome TaxID=410659 RepID=A0A1J5RH57_9ZZZZ